MLVSKDDFKSGKYLIPNLVNDKTIANLLTYFEREFLNEIFCFELLEKLEHLKPHAKAIIKSMIIASMWEKWQTEVSIPITPIGQVNPEGQVSSNNHYSMMLTEAHNDWVMIYRKNFHYLYCEFAKIGIHIEEKCFELIHPLLR